MSKLKYVTEKFLSEFETEFDEKYLPLYMSGDKEAIQEIFANPNNVIESNDEFKYQPLKLISENPTANADNIRTIWESLGHLTPVVAEQKKLWIAMVNTYYLDYHLDQISLVKRNKAASAKSQTIFNNGKKRSLMINSVAVLWWLSYYTRDESNLENPYYYTDFFVKGNYRGNAVALTSSNFISNKNIALGILSAVKELVETNKMVENRYSYSNSNKILNMVGGVRILDMLEQDEVKQIILDNLLDTNKIVLPK
ncbi:MAG: DUF6339 family protein [Micrococcaceae bacterium]